MAIVHKRENFVKQAFMVLTILNSAKKGEASVIFRKGGSFTEIVVISKGNWGIISSTAKKAAVIEVIKNFRR